MSDEIDDPKTWGPREVIGDLLNHLASRHDMRDFPRCLSRARELFADLAAPAAGQPAAKDAPEQIDIHIIRTYLADALRKSITDKRARLLAIASLDRLAQAREQEGALRQIAAQWISDEIDEDIREDCDYQAAYEECVNIARAALAREEPKQKEEKDES